MKHSSFWVPMLIIVIVGGIWGYRQSNQQELFDKTEMKALSAVIAAYSKSCGVEISNLDLAQLAAEPTPKCAEGLRISKSKLADRWGHPYQLKMLGNAFFLISLGRDNAEGGNKDDSDQSVEIK